MSSRSCAAESDSATSASHSWGIRRGATVRPGKTEQERGDMTVMSSTCCARGCDRADRAPVKPNHTIASQGHQCYHCKAWIEPGQAHDCWTTTEAELTRDLTEDLRDAWERLRETALEFGDQRVYASHHSIMFSRQTCYFFVRPKAKYLEVVVFLGRMVKSPLVQRVTASSKTKQAHVFRLMHRDQVEAPLTDWMREAYELQTRSAAKPVRKQTRRA